MDFSVDPPEEEITYCRAAIFHAVDIKFPQSTHLMEACVLINPHDLPSNHDTHGALFLNCPNILCRLLRLSLYFQNFFAYLMEVYSPKYRHLLPPFYKLQGLEFSPITSVTVFSNGNKSYFHKTLLN